MVWSTKGLLDQSDRRGLGGGGGVYTFNYWKYPHSNR